MSRYLIGYRDKRVFFVVYTVNTESYLQAALDYSRKEGRVLCFFSKVSEGAKFILVPKDVDDRRILLYIYELEG